jgi:hypothetical protein
VKAVGKESSVGMKEETSVKEVASRTLQKWSRELAWKKLQAEMKQGTSVEGSGRSFAFHLLSGWLLMRFIPLSRRMSRHHPKLWLTLNRLHHAKSQKTEHFATTAMGTTDPTVWSMVVAHCLSWIMEINLML